MSTTIYTPNKRSIEYRTEQFFIKSEKVHKGRYDLSKVVYVKYSENVIFGCAIHGDFSILPNNFLNGRGCPACGITARNKSNMSSTREFTKRSKLVHNNFYNYDSVIYNGNGKVVIIGCPKHGDYPQRPTNHLSGDGCPLCSKKGYSKIAIKWLDSIGLDIRHAENGGEYRLPNTKYRVDGYCKETNTVYEFHGDDWHGNPDKFLPEDICHPFNKNITAGELYQKTIERENEIKSLGYNLVVMWENDYNQ